MVGFTLAAVGQKSEWTLIVDGYTDVDVMDCAVDANGSSYFGMIYTHDIVIPGLNTKFPLSPYVASALLKVSPEGKPQWAQAIVGHKDTRIKAMCVDQVGNVFVTGYADGNASFSIDKPKQKEQVDERSGNAMVPGGIFIASYSPKGELRFAKQFLGSWGEGLSISVNSKGDIYVTAYHKSELKDASGRVIASVEKYKHTTSFRSLLIFDAKGEWQKTVPLGKELSDSYIHNFRGKFNPMDEYVLYGSYAHAFQFSEKDSVRISHLESLNSFIVVYNKDLSVKWIQHLGGEHYQLVKDIAFDKKGCIYFTGTYDVECIISKGIEVVSRQEKPKQYGTDFFYGKCLYDGTMDYTYFFDHPENGYNNIAHQIGVDGNGEAHVIGNYNDTIEVYGKTIPAGYHNPQPFEMIWKRDKLISLTQTGRNDEHFIFPFFYDLKEFNYAGGAWYYGEKGYWGSGKEKRKLTSKDYGRVVLLYGGSIPRKPMEEDQEPNMTAEKLLVENLKMIEPALVCLPESKPEEWLELPIKVALADSISAVSEVASNDCVIKEIDLSAMLYPNPTRDRTQLELKGFENKEVLIKIYDEKGALIYQQSISKAAPTERLEMDLSNQSPGIYFFAIVSGTNYKVVRLSLVR